MRKDLTPMASSPVRKLGPREWLAGFVLRPVAGQAVEEQAELA